MSGIRAALFGVRGKHAEQHLRTLQVMDEIEEIVLWDEDAEALERVRSDRGGKVAAVFTNHKELLDQEKILFAIAAVRNDRSADMCTQLLQSGVHVISEKPIGLNAAETARVVNAAKEAGVRLGVFYTNRYHPLIVEARQLAADGVIGRVTSCEARMVTTQAKFRNPKGWLFDKDKAGGGILSWLGCHYIDLMRYVLNDEIAAVSAFVDTRSDETIDVEDVATVVLRMRSGALGTLTAGYQLALPANLGPTYDTYLGFRGTGGRLVWDGQEPPALYLETTHDDWSAAPVRRMQFNLADSPAYAGTHGLQFISRFVGSVMGDGEPPATGQDALEVAKVIDAAYESSRTGQTIHL